MTNTGVHNEMAQSAEVAQILALSHYLHGENGYLYEAWASTHFSATFAQAAREAGFEDYTPGVTFSWSAKRPDALSVNRDGVIVSKHEFKELVLTGDLAQVFHADLHRLASTKMRADILAERERALMDEAHSRVLTLTQAAIPSKRNDHKQYERMK